MPTKHVVTASGGVDIELTQAELDQRAADEAAAAVTQAAVDAENARVVTIAEDTDTIGLLTQLKTATTTQINNYVDNNIELTGATVAALRTEVQTVLRVIVKRQLKVMALLARRL